MHSQAIVRMGVNQASSVADYFRTEKQITKQTRLLPMLDCWQAIMQGMQTMHIETQRELIEFYRRRNNLLQRTKI